MLPIPIPLISNRRHSITAQENSKGMLRVGSAPKDIRVLADPSALMLGTIGTIGSIPNKVNRKISSPESGKTLDMSYDDIRVIQQTWTAKPDKNALSRAIFCRVFTIRPELLQLFGIGANEDIENCPKLNNHCVKFGEFWSQLIERLGRNDSDAIVAQIRRIGILHCSVRRMNFDAQNWLLLKMSMLECICQSTEDIFNREFQCWNKLLMFVISEMKDAFNSAIRRNTWPELVVGPAEPSGPVEPQVAVEAVITV